jgi:peptide/nickel transport system substrate-binding protein
MMLLTAFFAVLLGALPSECYTEEFQVSKAPQGRRGGRLIIAQRAEPRTLNPVAALDVGSREVIGLTMADLIHVDRNSFQAAPALARRWTASKDGMQYTLYLRRGLRFSDGYPFDADDVLFTFHVHVDEQVRSPQRELLIIGGKPIALRKLNSHTVLFELAAPYPAAERLFESIGILPKHLLEKPYAEGRLASMWGITASPSAIAGLGPFRLKEYVPGQRIVLERNPHYWKVDSNGNRLPYLDQVVYLFVGTEDAQVIRFQSGETHVISDLGPENFTILEKERQRSGFRMVDLGPGLEYSFLLFNLNDLNSKGLPSIREKQSWFHQVAFRQAISSTIDRDGIVQLVYRGMAAPLWAHVTQGNRPWVNSAIPRSPRSLERARESLKSAGFSWNSAGKLVDQSKREVAFSILTNSGNSQRARIATIIQGDLKDLGVTASIVSLEFRAMLDRIFNSYEYEAAVMTLASGDTDPNAEVNVWTSKGSTHVWNLNGAPAPDWEREIDQLMRQQMTTVPPVQRKRLYDRVQELVAVKLPLICLVSPHVLVGTTERLHNFSPSILRPYVLWNADELYF